MKHRKICSALCSLLSALCLPPSVLRTFGGHSLLPAFCFLLSLPARSQDVLRDTSLISELQLQELRTSYGKNKKIEPRLEKIALYTLSYFPDLADHHITIRSRKKGAPISARPAWGTLFRSAKKRTYMVFINSGADTTAMFSSIYHRASIPGQIGILGHELCHIAAFSRKTSFGLLGLGINHLSKPYMDRFEFFTDSATIARGLGYYLVEWASMFDKFFEKYGSDPFKNNNTPTGERYMSAATVRKYIARMEATGAGK